jgi:serine/threonine-protein kinase
VLPAKEYSKSNRRTKKKRIVKKRVGRLRLTTMPWTEIFHKGRLIGQTPLVDVPFKPGVVRLRAVNKDRGIDTIITVRIKPGELVIKRVNIP